LQSQAGDVDAYLQTLDMQISFNEFDDIGRSRITQLINKSNQFNLTTKRYTEAEVLSAQNDPDCFTLQVRLADVFGDNGMISVIICRLHQGNWMIDTWLMSCRVLKRKVEIAVLMELVANAKLRGISKIIGQYIPTDRNGLVKNHYSELGFAHFDTDENGVSNWILDVESTATVDLPMTVHRGV